MQLTGILLKNCHIRLQRSDDGRIFGAWVDERRGAVLCVRSQVLLEISAGQTFLAQIQSEGSDLLLTAVLESVEPAATAPKPSFARRPRSTSESDQVPAARYGFRIQAERLETASGLQSSAVAVTVRGDNREFEVLPLGASERSLDLAWPQWAVLGNTLPLSVHTLLGVIRLEADVAEVSELSEVPGYVRVRVQPTNLDVLDAARWHTLLGPQSNR